MRIDEINTRLAAIAAEVETASGEALAALETEVETLTAERQRLLDEVQTRQQLRANIAAGVVTGTTIETHEEETNMENRTYTVGSAEYREAYLMHLQGRELNAEQRERHMNFAAAIPTQTMNAVFRYLEDSPILSRIDMTHIPGNIVLPVEGDVAEASWVDMIASSSDSADTITSISLGAHKLIKTVEITADVEAMAIDAFETWLVSKLGEKIQKALDNAVFNGTGINQPTGICTSVTATGTFTKAKAKYSDLVAIIAALPSGPAKNAVFAMPRKLFFTDVLGIEDLQGQPVVHADVESPAKYNILGYHVILDDNVPADNILFGDFKAYKMNIAKAPVISSDDSVGFRTGTRVYRALALADGELAMDSAFVRYTRGA